MSILVIVESPAKCSKIQNYLGNNYIVKASFGHIRNIDKKKGINAIEINNNFNPIFSIINEKKKYIKILQDCAKKASEVIIASDLDREGEAIGYHLVEVLKLDIKKTKRIVFNEITQKAIQNAINNPRNLDMNLIYAAQARQILDYIIGFDISPILWKYVRNNLSAGRCQSPGLKLICEKETEVNNFISNTYFDLDGKFNNCDDILFDCKSKTEFKSKEEVIINLEIFKGNDTKFTINTIENKQSISKPSSPYITSTIQQDSSNKLGISPKQTMTYLQKLYEAGKITYMRTDSKILSEQCIESLKTYIYNKYGNQYHCKRIFKDNSKNAQEAHECIRPVDISIENLNDLDFTSQEKKLYEIIWKRTVASQMADMITDICKVQINNNKNKILFETTFDKTLFLGYGIVYNYQEVNEIDNKIDKIYINQELNNTIINSTEKLTNPPPRYTEASIIKELEKKGIGRPSTFSSIVDTLFKRDYIKKDSRKGIDKEIFCISLLDKNNIIEKKKIIKTNNEVNKIFVTELGNIVNDFMLENFNNILDINFTSNMENNLDEIAKGNYNWISLVDSVYKSFHPKVISLSTKESNKKNNWDNIVKKNMLKPTIGINTNNNKNIYCYNGKYGPIIQEGDEKPIYVPLPNEYNLETINLEQCIELLTYPKTIGKINKKDVIICIGSNGYYVKYDNSNFSITDKNIDLKSIEDIIINKNKEIIKKITEDISIRNGKYGPYIIKITNDSKNNTRYKKKNNIIVKVPKKFSSDPTKMTLEDCQAELNKRKESKY